MHEPSWKPLALPPDHYRVVEGASFRAVPIGDVKSQGLRMSPNRVKIISEIIAQGIPMRPIQARLAKDGKWEVRVGGIALGLPFKRVSRTCR
jgi:hypothetical protein